VTDEHIEQLKAALDDGNNGQVWWIPSEDIALRVVKIGPEPKPKDGDTPEPTEVAYTSNGKWVALDPAEFHDFKLVRPVSDLFE
jgi:hypothetical protein